MPTATFDIERASTVSKKVEYKERSVKLGCYGNEELTKDKRFDSTKRSFQARSVSRGFITSLRFLTIFLLPVLSAVVASIKMAKVC